MNISIAARLFDNARVQYVQAYPSTDEGPLIHGAKVSSDRLLLIREQEPGDIKIRC